MSTKCLNPTCTNDGNHSRGLCRNCYHKVLRLLSKKLATWETLEQSGKVLKKKRRLAGNRTGLSETTKWFLDGTLEKAKKLKGDVNVEKKAENSQGLVKTL